MFQYSFYIRNGKTRYRGLFRHRLHAFNRGMLMNLRRLALFQITINQRPLPEPLSSLMGKAEYIQALIDARDKEDIDIFLNCMTKLHCTHLKQDIDQFMKSVATELVDKGGLQKEMADNWSIKPSLADKLADILVFVADKDEIKTEAIIKEFGFAETTAKRYLRQLAEFGYLEAHGGNRNRTYCIKTKSEF